MDTSLLPTKNNLMRLKSKLKLSMQGQELLERKKTILEVEKEKYIKENKKQREKLNKLFEEGLTDLKNASVDIGIEELVDISETVQTNEKIDIKYKTIMGVEIPSIICKEDEKKLNYSLYNTTISVDKTIERFNSIKSNIIKLAELDNTIIRLNRAIEKVNKRSNALKNIIIPEDEKNVKQIENIIEEREREEFSRLKVVKNKIKNTK